MQKYIKTYMDSRWYDSTEFIPCEVCWNCKNVDIHHIEWRIWDKLNNPDNLIALCRYHHEYTHRHNTESRKKYLKEISNSTIVFKKMVW